MLGQAERLYELNSLISPLKIKDVKSKVISITSGKGGTGKSFIASNLALQLANTGKKVLLVDLDINLANQNVLFNISSQKTLYHYLTFNCNLEDIVHFQTDNLHLILGESGKLDHPNLNEDRVNLLIKELKKLETNYDVILLDTSSGIENGTLQLLLHSDEIIFVTSPEPTSVMDAYVIFKLLKSNGFDVNSNIIVNKCLSPNDGEEAFENLSKATKHFLDIDINYLGQLPFSAEVIRSIQDQNPLIQSQNNSNISDQIKLLADKIKLPTIG